MRDKVEIMRDQIVQHAAEIEKLFKDKVNVTIIVRNLDRQKANVIISNEENFALVASGEFLQTVG